MNVREVKLASGEVVKIAFKRNGQLEILEDYPKLVVPIKVHPTKSMWEVTLTDGETYTVAWGNLREWLRQYAR